MTETFYADRDNEREITMQMRDDDTDELRDLTEAEMSAITKVEIHYDDTYYDSDTYASGFDWTTYASSAKLVLKLGNILPVGRDRKAELIIYDAIHTNGIVWDQMDIKVSDEAEV